MMSKKYYTYRICLNDFRVVKIERYDPQNQSLGRASGVFSYQEKRQEIQRLLEIAINYELSEEQTCQLGEALFNSLFDSRLCQNFLDFYYKFVQEEEQFLRIELDIDEQKIPEVAALPWEFLCLPESTNQGTVWLATDPNLVFYRHRALWNSAKGIKLLEGEKLRIALAISSPKNLSNVEYLEVQEKLESLATEQSEEIELLPIINPSTPIAIDSLLERKPHIFHFIGHGRFEDEEGEKVGKIALVRPGLNQAKWVDEKFFASLFVRHRPGIVVLQVCEGGKQSESEAFKGVAAKIIGQNIPVVVAMQYEITNATANLFSDEFYRRLGKGEPVDMAVQNGRYILGLETQYQNRDFATPVIFMNLRNGYLFSDKSQDELLNKEQNGLLDLTGEHKEYLRSRRRLEMGLTDKQRKYLREEIERVLDEDTLRMILIENEEIFGNNFYNRISGSSYRNKLTFLIIELKNRELINDFIEVVQNEYPNFARDL